MAANVTSVSVNDYDVSRVTKYGGYNFTDATATDEPKDYFYWGARELRAFSDWYRNYHGYIAVIICVFGIIANILNVIVLTRRNMQSATNFILTALAVSDGLTMAGYLPFAIYYYCLYGFEPSPVTQTLGAAYFLLFYVYWSNIVHSVSIWLTVILAIFRYIYIKYPPYGVVVCSMKRAKLAVFLTVLGTTIVLIPNYICHQVTYVPFNHDAPNSSFWYHTVILAQETVNEKVMYNIMFWFNAILVKLLPSAMLTVLSILLIRCMRLADKRHRQLRNQSKLVQKEGEEDRSDGRTNRTTRMLLAVVVLFLLCELPQGMLNLFSGLPELMPKFYAEVADPLGDLMDILALFNNGINFILYCTMSRQFREVFCRVFIHSVQIRNSENGRGRFTLVPNNNSVSNANCTLVTKTSDV